MASIIPFDNAVIDGSSVAAPVFKAGSGYLQITSQDISTTTADGRIHNDRIAQGYDASFTLYGDQRTLASGAGSGCSISLKQGSSEIKTFSGLVSAEYSKSGNSTQISIKGDPA